MLSNLLDENLTVMMNTSIGGEESEYYYQNHFNFEEFFSGFLFKFDRFLAKMDLVWSIMSFLGNPIVVLVLMRKKSRNFSTSIFIMNLAIADFCCSTSTFEGFLLSNGYIKATYSDFDCKFRTFIPKMTQYVSTWMLVFISVERAVSVKLPHKVKTIFTVKLARFLTLLVWILSAAKASLNVSGVSMYTDIFTGKKGCFADMAEVLYNMDLILYMCLGILIPYPIILASTVITLSNLLQNKMKGSKSQNDKIKSITITLLIVNVVYLVGVSPKIALEVYINLWIRFSGNFGVPMTIEEYFKFAALMNIFVSMGFVTHALNFFIYFLRGSRFRNETKDLLFFCHLEKSKSKNDVNFK